MLVEIIYILLTVLALFATLMVVLSGHAVYSALYLVVTMIAIAGLFVMMNAQLAAALQVIVYAGAIMVLFLFVIMLLALGRSGRLPMRTRALRLFGLAFGLALLLQLGAGVIYLMGGRAYSPQQFQAVHLQEVTRILITDYLYAFEMTSVLLLIAVIGAIVLARRRLVQGPEGDIEHPEPLTQTPGDE